MASTQSHIDTETGFYPSNPQVDSQLSINAIPAGAGKRERERDGKLLEVADDALKGSDTAKRYIIASHCLPGNRSSDDN